MAKPVVVRDEQGHPLFLHGIAFDITESKRAEQTLRRSAEELEQKVRERTIALEEAHTGGRSGQPGAGVLPGQYEP